MRRQMAAKALNVPYDTMGDINVTHGNSLREMIVGAFVGAALFGGGLAGALYLLPDEKVVETVIEKQTDVWDYKVEMKVDRKP